MNDRHTFQRPRGELAIIVLNIVGILLLVGVCVTHEISLRKREEALSKYVREQSAIIAERRVALAAESLAIQDKLDMLTTEKLRAFFEEHCHVDRVDTSTRTTGVTCHRENLQL